MCTGFPFLLLTHTNKMVATQLLSVTALFRSQFVAKPYVDLENYEYYHYIVVSLIFSKIVAVCRSLSLTLSSQIGRKLQICENSLEALPSQ